MKTFFYIFFATVVSFFRYILLRPKYLFLIVLVTLVLNHVFYFSDAIYYVNMLQAFEVLPRDYKIFAGTFFSTLVGALVTYYVLYTHWKKQKFLEVEIEFYSTFSSIVTDAVSLLIDVQRHCDMLIFYKNEFHANLNNEFLVNHNTCETMIEGQKKDDFIPLFNHVIQKLGSLLVKYPTVMLNKNIDVVVVDILDLLSRMHVDSTKIYLYSNDRNYIYEYLEKNDSEVVKECSYLLGNSATYLSVLSGYVSGIIFFKLLENPFKFTIMAIRHPNVIKDYMRLQKYFRLLKKERSRAISRFKYEI